MKITSVFHRESLFSGKKIIYWLEQLRKITFAELIWCIVAGVLSQGKLFGVLKPFGLAFYASYAKKFTVKTLMTVCIFAGNAAGGDFFGALKQTAVIFLFELLNKLFFHDENSAGIYKKAFAIGAASAMTGFFVFLISGKTMEALLIAIMEVILTGVLTPVFSSPLAELRTNSVKDLKVPKNIKYLGLLLMEAAFLLGISGVGFMNVSIDRLLSCLGILVLTRHFGTGAGAGAGAAAGMAISGSMGSFPEYTGLYAVSGLIAGMLQKSKIAAVISFIVTHMLFYILSDSIAIEWPALLLAAVIFLLMPDIKEGKLAVIKNGIDGESLEPGEIKRVKKNISGRLEDISKALYKLGHTVEKQITGCMKDDPNEECKAVIGQLTDQICRRCNKSLNCWETKLIYTYNVMCKMVEFLQKGETGSSGAPLNNLKHFCSKSETVIDTLSRIIEIKRVEKIWQKNAIESRNVISEQIYSLSEILTKISQELFNEEEFFGEEEKNICSMLRKNRYPAVRTEVKKGRNARFTAEVCLEDCMGHKNCQKEVENIVSQVLGVKVQLEEGDCKNKGRENCMLFFKEKENLNVTTGIARLKKNNGSISGDTFTFLKTKDGKYIVAISDGMGSGIEANKLSETAIGLFEQLLDCGLSVRLSLSLVNMMLSVRSPEQYATMDISAIDLYTGETEFYKMGAMPTLIINERNMDMVEVNNLPAGLHRENSLQSYRRKVADGEFIIMMTDGVYENIGKSSTGNMLEAVLSGIKTLNPQEMAEHMLENICTSNENVPDDMTVLVAKLWKKAG